MATQFRRLEICLSQLRSRESRVKSRLNKLCTEKTEAAARLGESKKDFRRLCRSLEKIGNGPGFRLNPCAAQKQAELIGRRLGEVRTRQSAAQEKFKHVEKQADGVAQELLACSGRLERLQKIAQARAMRVNYSRESTDQADVIESATTAKVVQAKRKAFEGKHEISMHRSDEIKVAHEDISRSESKAGSRELDTDVVQSAAPKVVWRPVGAENPAGTTPAGIAPPPGSGAALAEAIIHQIESLESWQGGSEQGISLRYTTQSGSRVGLMINSGGALGLLVTLTPEWHEEARRLRQDRHLIRRALERAGLSVSAVRVSEVQSEEREAL